MLCSGETKIKIPQNLFAQMSILLIAVSSPMLLELSPEAEGLSLG